MKSNEIIKKVIIYLGFLIAAIICSFIIYLRLYFKYVSFEQLFYNFLYRECLNIVSLSHSIKTILLGTVVFFSIFILPLAIHYFLPNLKFKISLFKKKISLFPLNKKFYSLFLGVFSLLLLLIQIDFFGYFMAQLSNSNLYEEYYVDYENEKVNFPLEKQNLIYIYVESLEDSVFGKANGGIQEKSYAPKLEKLAQEYINFSDTEDLGGFKHLNGTSWTASALVGQTSGIPIYIETENEEGKFLEGVTSLGEILQNEGYKNYLMMGSDSNFANKRKYFREHGDYLIFDYPAAINNQLLDSNYFVWWGFEDQKLYDFSKAKLLEISNNDEPFNMTLLTVNTHYFEGFTDESCPNEFNDSYANSYYCMDIQLTEFINWITEQDFYKNTTVVIAGDHLSMRDNFFDDNDNERTVFNLFINPNITSENLEDIETKNRDFTALDMFPTTLAALGATIEDDRLALGTNLFSNKETLSEELGYEKFSWELRKSSNYYDEKILN